MRSISRLLRSNLAELDRDLARLGRGAGALRLRLGEALERIAVQGGHHACGFSSLTAYALERCERSGRWALESRMVARRLAELPLLRAALMSGELSWSMVELLSRHASADDESALLARARSCTVRQMREALKVGPEDEDGESEPPMRTLTVTVPTEEAWAFECTRLLVEQLEGGKASTDVVMTALLAEGEIALQGMVPAGQRDGFARKEDEAARTGAWLEELARYRAEAEKRCEARIPRGGSSEACAARGASELDGERCETRPRGGSTEACPAQESASELEDDPIALDRCIRSLARELAERELAMGRAAVRLFAADGWRRLGYASAAQYARERVGLSYSALKSHMALARRAADEPAVREAMCAGRIGREAALLVARVATPETIDAWLARAEQRTIKHLHEEVKAAELIARVMERGDVEPPDAEMLRTVQELECAVLSGRVYRERFGAGADAEQSQMSAQGGVEGIGRMNAQAEDEGISQMSALAGVEGIGQMSAQADHEGMSQMSARSEGVDGSEMFACDVEDVPPPRRGAGRSTLRLWVSDETYRVYRALEQDYLRRTACPLGFVGFLCLSLWDSWHAGLGREVAYGGIYARDRYRCSSPVCRRSDVTPHHLRFRSQGGDDTAENVASLCVWCHLEGVHGGRIRALPPASDVRWTLGERPILVVHGRRKVALGEAA